MVGAMEKAVIGLGGLLFLLFFISQFIALFTYTNLATIAAVKVGDWLETRGLARSRCLWGLCSSSPSSISSSPASFPKWAIFAPVFVPLMMRLDVAPEAVLAAYRVGDSPDERYHADDGVFPTDRGIRREIPERRGRGNGRSP